MEKPSVRISVRNLVEFLLRSGDLDNRKGDRDKDAMLKGSRLHRKIQRQMGGDYRAEVSLKRETEYEDVRIQIEGRADGIFTSDDTAFIDEIKGVYKNLEYLKEPVLVHRAQAMCYALIYGEQEGLSKVGVQMTYAHLDTEEIRRFSETFPIEELQEWYQKLVDEYHKWISYQLRWKQERDASMTELAFPFLYREGQRKMVTSVYHTISEGRQIFIQAPTGVGKTMSTIFPAVRAVGEGKGETIFYLTAKTITRTVAEEAFSILQEKGLRFKVLTITAKEKLCPCEKTECNPDNCPYAKGHFDRINDAVYELWTEGQSFGRETLLAHAEKWQVCPFEMCLDLALWVDAVICDYNYAFDPNVHLKRFFGDSVSGDYIFLIDEAHNLPDRARDMHSESLLKSSFVQARKLLGKGKSRLKTALGRANAALLEWRRRCEEEGGRAKTLMRPERDEELDRVLQRLCDPLEAWLDEHRDPTEAHAALLQLYFDIRAWLRVAETFDDHFVLQAAAFGSDLRLTQLCLDPSEFLKANFALGRAAVLFSATLAPAAYYKDLCGLPDARAVALKSPFPPENFGLFAACQVSTRYRDREGSIAQVAGCLAAMAGAKPGNYLAFFPSYSYLEQVRAAFAEAYPGIPLLVQQSALDEAGRADFLAQFCPDPQGTMLGFAVMGGVFGEGVDLAGSRLIGCAIVGVGLPQVSPRQEMLRHYFEEKDGSGFDYAYRFPGMNKVLQAAGRVIRTETDRGVVLLLDDRFAQEGYRRLFPRHWAHIQYLSGTDSLRRALDDFWRTEP